MTVTAALAWYMEPPAFLDRCIRSLMPLCDRLVALDGRWALFPGERDLSTPEERRAIERAAAESGLRADVQLGAPLDFESQVAKRDRLMELAGEDADWILVIDGDEFLAPLSREAAAAIRAELEQASLDVATVLHAPLNRSWPFNELPTNESPIRRLYRAGTRLPGPAHNGYQYEGRWLNGDAAHVRLEPSLDLSRLIRLQHDNQNRGAERKQAAKDYRLARRQTRVEAWRR